MEENAAEMPDNESSIDELYEIEDFLQNGTFPARLAGRYHSYIVKQIIQHCQILVLIIRTCKCWHKS